MKLISNFKLKTLNFRSQEGITLLTSILVLASVTVVSFSIGALTLRELRASRQLSLSEPAINSAESGGETALFFRLRGINQLATTCPALSTGTLPSGADYEFCSNLYDDPFDFETSFSDTDVVLLYNPADSTDPAAGYSSVVIDAISGSGTLQMRAYAYDLEDPNSCPANSGIIIVPGNGSIPVLDPGKSYAVFLFPCGSPGGIPESCGGSGGTPSCLSGTVTGTIDGTTSGGIDGIPSESPTIETTGVVDTGLAEDLRRKIQIFLNP